MGAAAVLVDRCRWQERGMTAIPAADLSAFGVRVEAEELACEQHALEVQRARARIARGVPRAYGEDEATAAEAPPATPVSEMMRAAMGGTSGDEIQGVEV
jgi:hypothetical protein